MTDDLDAFGDDLEALETTMGGSRATIAAFDAEMRSMRSTLAGTGTEVANLSKGIESGLRGAFEGLVFDGAKLSDALRGVAKSMVDAAYGAAIKPVVGQIGNILGSGVESVVSGLMPFEKGGTLSDGRVRPFASGGIVEGATMFPMRGGAGLMGEAGPEAIMPLARGADGRLGVASAANSGPVTVVMNISTADVEGFRRSQSQIAAQAVRALGKGRRNR